MSREMIIFILVCCTLLPNSNPYASKIVSCRSPFRVGWSAAGVGAALDDGSCRTRHRVAGGRGRTPCRPHRDERSAHGLRPALGRRRGQRLSARALARLPAAAYRAEQHACQPDVPSGDGHSRAAGHRRARPAGRAGRYGGDRRRTRGPQPLVHGRAQHRGGPDRGGRAGNRHDAPHLPLAGAARAVRALCRAQHRPAQADGIRSGVLAAFRDRSRQGGGGELLRAGRPGGERPLQPCAGRFALLRCGFPGRTCG